MKQIKVLIVDDVLEVRRFLCDCLKATSPQFVTHEEGTGRRAIESLEKGKFDLVLCDWDLPDKKGDEILSWVRTESKCKELPFIMVTGFAGRDYITRAQELGVTDYVVKPINYAVLSRKIFKVLKGSLESGEPG